MMNKRRKLLDTGAIHVDRNVDEICVDETYRLVTTPAYMLASTITDASKGITKLVEKVLKMAQ